MSIKLVVFDMAGTTVEDNNNVAAVLQYAMKEFGYNVTIDDVNKVMGYPKPVAITELLVQYSDNKQPDEQYVNHIHDVFVAKMLDHYRLNPGIREKEGVRDTFLALKEKNIKIGIDTGFSRDIADTIIDRLGWKKEGLYDISITSDEVANGRPFPDMIYKAMNALDISDTDEVAKVGDTVSDLQEGNAAGCKYVIGVTSGSYSEDELRKEKHTHLVSRLVEVLPIISGTEIEQYN